MIICLTSRIGPDWSGFPDMILDTNSGDREESVKFRPSSAFNICEPNAN